MIHCFGFVSRYGIFRNGFNDGFDGVGTLANEFGDVLFGLQRPDYNNTTNKMGLRYEDIPTTRFSSDGRQVPEHIAKEFFAFCEESNAQQYSTVESQS